MICLHIAVEQQERIEIRGDENDHGRLGILPMHVFSLNRGRSKTSRHFCRYAAACNRGSLTCVPALWSGRYRSSFAAPFCSACSKISCTLRSISAETRCCSSFTFFCMALTFDCSALTPDCSAFTSACLRLTRG